MDSKMIEKNIREGIYTHKPNTSTKSTGRFWSTFDRIFDAQTGELIDGFVCCRICMKTSKYNSTKGITNLNNHSDICKVQTQTLRSFISRENVIKNEHKKELCFQTVAASVKDIRTFNLTEKDGVFNLIYTVWNLGAKIGAVSEEELRRALPDPTTVSRNINRLMEESKKNLIPKLKAQIDCGYGLAMTTDIWQDNYKRISYFCITVHFYDQNAKKIVDYILTFTAMDPARKKDHVHLWRIIEEKLSEHDLLQHIGKIVFISDRGGNIRKALKNTTRLNCFPHFCHNIAKHACKIESIKQLIDNCAALVKYFKFNGLNNLLNVSLKSAISTRFNYVFMMFVSINNEWDAIKEILTQRHELRRIENIDRDCLRKMIEFLNAFNIASKLTESTQKETLAYVWISITQICSLCRVHAHDPSYMKAIKARSLEYIESKFVLHQYHRIATFLHPNYKSLNFCSSEQKQKAIRDTKHLINQMVATTPSPPPPSSSSSSAPSSSSSSNSSYRRSSRSSTSSTSSSVDSNSSFLSNYFNRCEDDLDEVDIYINMQYIPDESINVFDWWIERKTIIPNLFKIAMKIHSTPASSMQSERTFSRSGMTISSHRTNLDPRTVENLMILNKNFEFGVSFLIYIVEFFL